MLPSEQRLEAGDGAVFQAHDRLVGEGQFLALDGAAQVGFELQPIGADRAERRPERLDAVAAEALGLVHGELGILDHVLGRGLRRGPGDQADRGGQHDLALGEGDRRLDRLVDRIGDRGDAGRILLGQQHQRELVAGKARQRVARLQDAMQTPRDGEQDGVAGRDAEPVIDLLEAVDVDDEDGRPELLLGLGERDHALQPVHEQFAVRQPGQIVVHGVVQQPLLGLLLVGDVDQRADAAQHLAVGTDHRPCAQREPVIVAVSAAQPQVLRDAAAPMLQHHVERRAETCRGRRYAGPAASCVQAPSGSAASAPAAG